MISKQSARKLVSGSVLRVLNLGAQLAVSLVMLPFIVDCLGDRMYGFWSLAWSIIGYFGFLDFGIGAAVSRYIARRHRSRGREGVQSHHQQCACTVYRESPSWW